jgi:hypothetical protein
MASSAATDRSWRSSKLLVVASLSLHQRSPSQQWPLRDHELGFLERQGAGLPGDVVLASLVAWRSALLDSSCQALAFRVANARLLGIKVDDIAC